MNKELEVSRGRGSKVIIELTYFYDAKLASLIASITANNIDSLFLSDVENNREICPKAGQLY